MITRDTWLKALEEAQAAPLPPDDPSVVTLTEFVVILGKGRHAAELAMQKLVRSGRAELTSKQIRQLNNTLRRVPAYRLLPDEPTP